MLALSRWILCGSLWLFLGPAGATTPANNSRQGDLDIAFDPGSALLSEGQKALVDEQAERVKECSGWPAQANATIWYELSGASLPRKDYQLIGERIEALRTYLLSRHGFPEVWAGIRIGEYQSGAPWSSNYRQPSEARIHILLFCLR